MLFLADDCTYRDIGCYGSDDSLTPAINRLAAEGMRFNKCYQAVAMCSPTRHNLYNGLYPVRTGAYPNHAFARDDVKSMPHYLGELGYRVAMIGKSHVGPHSVYPFEYLGDKAEGTDHLDMELSAKFLKEMAARREPFCLVVCSHQPHGPHTVGDRSLFDAEKLTLQKNMIDTPEFRSKFVEYLAEINFMDGQVATLLKQLQENSLDDSSLFVFLGEQGSSFPLSKWTCYEDGIKSAFVARWPGKIGSGTVSNALVEYSDILPTFIAAAGGTIPEHLDGVSLLPIFKEPGHKGKKYSFSMQTTRGIIKGSDYFGIRSVTDGHFRYIYNLSPEVKFSNGVTEPKGPRHWWGTWTRKAKDDPSAKALVDKYTTRPAEELYDLNNDPDNLNNLAIDPKHNDRRKQMRAAVMQWMKDCGDKGLETELLALQRIGPRRTINVPEISELLNPLNFENELNRTDYVPGQTLEGYIEIPVDGYYTFYKWNKKRKLSTSITIGDKIVLASDGRAKYGIVGLKQGLHRIDIVADRKGREQPGDIKWSGPNRLARPLETASFQKVMSWACKQLPNRRGTHHSLSHLRTLFAFSKVKKSDNSIDTIKEAFIVSFALCVVSLCQSV